MDIRVNDDVQEMGIFLFWVVVEGVKVSKTEGEALKIVKRGVDEIRKRYSLESLKDDPTVKAYRKFYWRIGIDPTKTRPSSEALVRRILRGKSFPLINNVVDAGNLVSALTLIPIGLYDVDKITGNPILRMAEEGELFRPIGGETELLTGKEVVLADNEKVMFLYPHRDSKETAITEETKRVLVVAAGVPEVDRGLVKRAAKMSADYIAKFSGGSVSGRVKGAP